MLRILAVLCPPLAVAATGKFQQLPASLLLTLAFYLPGVLHAFWVVSRSESERRNSALLDAMAAYYA